MSSYLVTGAGRGIGLELVKQLQSLPQSQVSTVFATTRSSPGSSLQSLIDNSAGRVVHVPMQITEKASIDDAVSQVKSKVSGKGLDCVINNAGVMPFVANGTESMTDLVDTFKINVESVHLIIAAFLPLLREGKGKKIANITTTLGSITQAPKYSWAPAPAYKITKAALNMLTVQYALDLEKEGFAVIAISPGWLKTDLGSQQADLDVDVGTKAVLDIVFKSGPDSNGKYLNIHIPGWENAEGPNQYNGKEPPF